MLSGPALGWMNFRIDKTSGFRWLWQDQFGRSKPIRSRITDMIASFAWASPDHEISASALSAVLGIWPHHLLLEDVHSRQCAAKTAPKTCHSRRQNRLFARMESNISPLSDSQSARKPCWFQFPGWRNT